MTIRNKLVGIGTVSPMARFHSREPSVLGAAPGSFQLFNRHVRSLILLRESK